MTEKFKKSYCQGIRLVLLWIPIGMDPLTLDLKTNKQTKSVLKICDMEKPGISTISLMPEAAIIYLEIRSAPSTAAIVIQIIKNLCF